MKLIYNNFIPFKGFAAINLFGVIFARKGKSLPPHTINHEKIHTAQMRELGYIGFYLLYFVEWVYRLIFHTRTAYRAYRLRWRRTSTRTTTITYYGSVNLSHNGEDRQRLAILLG